jgi:hypothetical protein
LKKRIVTISFEAELRFKKLIDRRAGSLGISNSELIRNAILFDAVADCDGEAFAILSEKVREKSLDTLRQFANKLGIGGSEASVSE